MRTVGKKMDTEVEHLKNQLSQKHLKLTKQREIILDAFLKNDHITAEALYQQISQTNIHLGIATIYRTLNLLCELGIGQERHFGDNKTTFDNVLHKKHHDHMICHKCGKILEFECPDIEKLQEEMAEKYGFILQTHKLELYGCCKDTQHCGKAEGAKGTEGNESNN
jgi:Fur family ferric uptake transcriptional regulator